MALYIDPLLVHQPRAAQDYRVAYVDLVALVVAPRVAPAVVAPMAADLVHDPGPPIFEMRA